MFASESEDEDGAVATLDSHGRIWGTSAIGLDFALKSCDNAVRPALLGGGAFAGLLRDCRLVDGPTLPDTFWLSATSAPRTRLEQLAREVFEWHTAGCSGSEHFDPESSGAEWWVQIRDHAVSSTSREPSIAGEERAGVAPHWDKDENLRRDFGIWAHPQLSTVTYLTGGGAPTVVLRKCINRAGDGDIVTTVHSEEICSSSSSGACIDSAVISQPVPGKHLVFDGRLLHLVAPELAAEPPSDQSVEPDTEDNGVTESTSNNRAAAPIGAPRVTFLVNIWLHHKPRSLRPLPDALVPLLQPATTAAAAPAQWLQLQRIPVADGRCEVDHKDSLHLQYCLTEPSCRKPLSLRASAAPAQPVGGDSSSKVSQCTGRPQRWPFGPTGVEYLLRWDDAPTPHELRHAFRTSGASTVQLDRAIDEQVQHEHHRLPTQSGGGPWVAAVRVSSAEAGAEGGVESAETRPSPSKRPRRSSANQ